jgi:serine/threonine protein kinase
VHGASIGGSESEGGLEAAERVGRISTESARDSTASSSSAGGGALAKIPAGLVVDEANVEVRSRISSGQFGDVYQGHWQGTDVAVKFIKCGNVHGEQQRCDALRAKIQAPTACVCLTTALSSNCGGFTSHGCARRVVLLSIIADFENEVNLMATLRHPSASPCSAACGRSASWLRCSAARP